MTDKPLVVLPQFLISAAALQKDVKAKLVRILWMLSQDFRHPSLQCKKVQGARNEVYECRVDQGIRLVYDVVNGMLRCLYVGDHDDALRYAMRAVPQATVVEVDDVEVSSPDRDVAVAKRQPPEATIDEEARLLTISQLSIELGCEE